MIEEVYELEPKDVVKEEIDKGKIIMENKDGEEKDISIDEFEEEEVRLSVPRLYIQNVC